MWKYLCLFERPMVAYNFECPHDDEPLLVGVVAVVVYLFTHLLLGVTVVVGSYFGFVAAMEEFQLAVGLALRCGLYLQFVSN